jgi:hypothetical protein
MASHLGKPAHSEIDVGWGEILMDGAEIGKPSGS